MKALVTGGGGFLGFAVVEALRAEGHEVTSISRRVWPEVEEAGAKSLVVDLGDATAVADAIEGHETVFHVASLTGIWGKRAEYLRTNVEGTRNVIEGCLRHRVGRLVYTSSPSVCFSGKGHRRASNDLPYPERYNCVYPETKAEAERLVLGTNRRGELATCSLRPHLIFGPRDPHLIPRLLAKARAGSLPIVGDGTNEVSFTWIENAAAAHLDAARTLTPDAPHAGSAYFIAQEDPVKLWEWLNRVFTSIGVAPITRRIPRRVAESLGAVCELVWNVLPLKSDPPMTRFLAAELASDHSYDLEPARRDFGYRERVNMEEATVRLIEHLRESGA